MTVRVLLVIALLLAWLPAIGKDAYPFRVITENFGHFHRILAINEGPAPVAAKIEMTMEGNAATDRQWPAYVTVPPGQSLPVGRVLWARNTVQGYSMRTTSSWRIGDFNATHGPDVTYRLPFADGLAFRIDQAFGGPITTHTSPESQHAVDITMPEGTLVLAARAGTVAEVESSRTEGGKSDDLLKRANGVVVAHDDGTMGRYGHFMPGRQLVKTGQQVQAGTPLGYSGNTGYSSGPHLHFAVTKVVVSPAGTLEEESLPLTFYAHNPPVAFKPQTGTMVYADYLNPVSTLQAKMTEKYRVRATGAASAKEPYPEADGLTAVKDWIENQDPWVFYGSAVAMGVVILMLHSRRRERQIMRRLEPADRYDSQVERPD